MKLLFAALLCFLIGTAHAQNDFLSGYRQAERHNQEMNMRNLMALQMQLQIVQRAQQIQAEQQNQQQAARDFNRQREQERQAQLDDINAKGRVLIADRAKGTCIGLLVDDAESQAILAKRGKSVGQLCGCVEEEMTQLLTVDLISQILQAVHQFSGDPRAFENSVAGKTYGTRYITALKGCVQR